VSNKQYRLYIDSTLELAETVVIKSDYEANSINDWVVLNYGESAVNYSDPTTWKYYMNICGEYHPTDEIIYITSLDTIGSIAFTKTNLDLHPATKSAYRYNSRYYRELLLEHPDKEQLIFGILYPANLTQAIESKNGKILSYPKYLIEDNEISLEEKIQKWIYDWLFRWYNVQFNNNHDYYYMATKAVLHLTLVGAILGLRLRACRTDEVHSFHVREYLSSHNGLDKYLDYMTRKQALFFYRNIAYIERNSGKQDTFKWLVEKVLTDRSIPLSQFTMRHDVRKLPNEYYPEIVFRKSAVNEVYSQQDSQDDTYDLTTILEKEIPLASYNKKFIDEHKESIKTKFIDSPSNVVQTKMLESSMLDYTDATPYTLQDIGFNHWVYFAHIGLYTAYVRIPHPRTGAELVLNAKDAVIYYMYLLMKSVDFVPTNIPKFGAMRVVRQPYATVANLMSVVDASRIPATKATELINTLPAVGLMVSINAFNSKANELYQAAQKQILIVASEERHYNRGLVHNMANALYQDALVDYTGGTDINYEKWVYDHALPGAELSQEECNDLYKVVYESATGISLKSVAELAALQKAMIGIMTQLSSYSIQFLTKINSASVRPLNWAMIRPDDLITTGKGYHQIEDNDITVLDVESEEFNRVPIELDPIVVDHNVVTIVGDHKDIDIPVKPSIDINATRRFIEISMMNYTVNCPIFETPPIGQVKYLPSYQAFYDLTLEQQKTIKSIYCDCFPDAVPNTKIELGDAISRDTLMSFKYLHFGQPVLKSFNFIYLPSDVENGIKTTISVDLDAISFSGGTLMMPGVAMIGYEHHLNIFLDISDNVNVNGFLHKPELILGDLYDLHDNFGLGISLKKIKLITDSAEFTMNNAIQYGTLDFKYFINEKHQSNISRVTELSEIGFTKVTDKYQSALDVITDKTSLPLTHEIDAAEITNKYVIDLMAVDYKYHIGENVAIEAKYISEYISLGFDVYNSDVYTALTNGPFLSDPDLIGAPYYSLGGFAISGVDGKVIFNIT